MKIDELIERLEELKNIFGNINVKSYNNMGLIDDITVAFGVTGASNNRFIIVKGKE